MATAILPSDDFHTNTDDQHLEIFCLIWLDDNINAKDNRDTEQKLRAIINRLKKFQNVEQCQKYIEQRSQKDRLIMIVSGRLGQKILPSIHKVRQIISIYVYCMDKERNKQWTSKFAKVKAVIVELDELVARIKADHKIQKIVEQPLSINIFTTGSGAGKSTGGVNGKFVFSQVLIDCLLRLKSTQADTKELIKLCKNTHEGNNFELSNLREFQKDYSPDKVLRWYTRDSFFYKTLNAVLRTENIHMIFLFRGFISDIQSQLTEHQAKNPLRVYRGQMISVDELKTLKQCRGQFISVNSFFSTSTDDEQALSFLNATDNTDNLQPVLFEIVADPKVAITKPFADISAYSEYPGESEILFMLGSIFRLNNIDYSNDNQVWVIRMTLCSEKEHDLKNVLMYMKQQLGNGETNLRTLGKVLSEMGKFDLAEQYFTRLLKELPPNDPLLGDLYEDLGKIASHTGDYDKSVQWHKKSLALKNPKALTGILNDDERSYSIGKFDDVADDDPLKLVKNEIIRVLDLEEHKTKDEIINDLLENGRQSLSKYKQEFAPKVYKAAMHENDGPLMKSLKKYFEQLWKIEYDSSNQWFILFLKEYKDTVHYDSVLKRTAEYGNKYSKDCPILSIVLQLVFESIDDKFFDEKNAFNDLWCAITSNGLKSIEDFTNKKKRLVLLQALCEYHRPKLFELLEKIQPKVEAPISKNNRSCVCSQDTQILWKFNGIRRIRVTWFFNGQPLPINNRLQVIETDDGAAILKIYQAEFGNQGVYTARATNAFGEAEAQTTLTGM
ncbi:unnamed protein product [Rotaria sordida]|uniref:Ig-like domain-containing protein n=1 Tax=Rotaria sordida TaxID=392033 RepID=A0A815CDB1_9BILA|nr:unnamed protein product [Rotaria sordida]CAF1559996.1 unnamed protein product [Rotaria sordida]